MKQTKNANNSIYTPKREITLKKSKKEITKKLIIDMKVPIIGKNTKQQ